MNKSSALELLELMEKFVPPGGPGYYGHELATAELRCCLNIAEAFNGVNSNLRASWLDVMDTCSKIRYEIWEQICGVRSAIWDFCNSTAYNEGMASDVTKKTIEASQQVLDFLGR